MEISELEEPAANDRLTSALWCLAIVLLLMNAWVTTALLSAFEVWPVGLESLLKSAAVLSVPSLTAVFLLMLTSRQSSRRVQALSFTALQAIISAMIALYLYLIFSQPGS